MTTSLGNESKRKRGGNRREPSKNDPDRRCRDCREDTTTMGLHRRNLRSASEQNENAGNGGGVIKHSVYLAVLDGAIVAPRRKSPRPLDRNGM